MTDAILDVMGQMRRVEEVEAGDRGGIRCRGVGCHLDQGPGAPVHRDPHYHCTATGHAKSQPTGHSSESTNVPKCQARSGSLDDVCMARKVEVKAHLKIHHLFMTDGPATFRIADQSFWLCAAQDVFCNIIIRDTKIALPEPRYKNCFVKAAMRSR